MPIEITMPRLSDTMEQGTVVTWNVAEGDTIAAGDVIADIETDKATMELQSFEDGVIAKLAVAEGQTVPVGTVIAIVAEEGEDLAAAAASAGSTARAPNAESERSQGSGTPTTSTPSATAIAEPPAPVGRVLASPLARKIAAERGIDLAAITGSGPAGRIVRKDVETAAPSAPAAARATAPSAPMPALAPTQSSAASLLSTPLTLEARRVPLSNMRATIARVLVESKQSIPHYQVTVSCRMDAVSALRTQLNEQLAAIGVKLSINDFLVRACALAMHKHPFVNSSWDPAGPAINLHGQVNIGVAISLPEERGGGLVVATIRGANRLGLRQISEETKRLAAKARDKGLTIEEMSDSTFTISNLGMFGVEHFTAIINPPNAAILAVGRAIEKPFIEYGDDGEPELVVGSEMAMTMSSDHRVIDGAMAAQYLATVKDSLENPATLLV